MLRNRVVIGGLVLAIVIALFWAVPTVQHTLAVGRFWSGYDTEGAPGLYQFVTDTVEQAYSYLELKQQLLGFSWRELREEYSTAVEAAASKEEQLYLIDELLSMLDDGHTQLTHEPISLDQSLPLALERQGDDFVITAFSERLAREVEWLEPGMKLLAVDGLSTGELYERLRADTGFRLLDQPQAVLLKRLFQTYWFHLKRHSETPAISSLIIGHSPVDSQELRLYWQPAQEVVRTSGIFVRPGGEKQGVSYHVMNGNLGYMRVDTFGRAITHKQIDNAFAELKDTDGLIIDLRYNGGGSFSEYGTHILSYLIDETRVVSSKQFRNSEQLHLFGKGALGYLGRPRNEEMNYLDPLEASVRPAKRNQYLGKPVVLLVNEVCFSSADIFIAAFVDLGIGSVVGRSDSLHSGQPLHISLPGDAGTLSVSSIISRSASGAIVEGREIRMSRFVPWTRGEILGQEDKSLNAALQLLMHP